MLSGVKVLVQVICTKCPERAEFRSVVAKAVVDIMDKLPVTLYASVVEWIKKVGTVDRYCELRNFCIGSYFTAVGLTRKILSNGLLSMLLEPTAITVCFLKVLFGLVWTPFKKWPMEKKNPYTRL
ncbi:uncharacterized protein LOC141877392 isoform X3 [Acropora palmata]|uniref:uncharacterized protein LOC141877392 isoform X3 n=1 Tax=Acropora palmata TaxID=6131 RepID=UPI003DA084BA